MRRVPGKSLVFGALLVPLFVGITAVWEFSGKRRTEQKPPYSEVFPSLHNVVAMSRLSHLVYKFRFESLSCDDFYPSPENNTEDLSCEWYLHEYTLGTQVLLVSNHKAKYIAVVFAGTDDVRTLFEDTNILTKPYGNNSTVSLWKDHHQHDSYYEKAKVHAGFNNAIFTHDIWEQIQAKTEELLRKHPTYRLWTTGHSLGGANAVLTATAFALLNPDRDVLSVSFGCPQTGNFYWREYFNTTSPLASNLGIWRVVLSWDLIARLPEFFYHVGHTIQIDGKTNDVDAYYEHYGDKDRGYAGVPAGWYAKSHAWLPYALNFHRMRNYVKYIESLEPESWVKTFFPTDPDSDDDGYDPPDDFMMPDDWPLPMEGSKMVGLRETRTNLRS